MMSCDLLEEFGWVAGRDSDGVALKRSGVDSTSSFTSDELLSEGVKSPASETARPGCVFDGRGRKMSGVTCETSLKGSS